MTKDKALVTVTRECNNKMVLSIFLHMLDWMIHKGIVGGDPNIRALETTRITKKIGQGVSPPSPPSISIHL
jgi:hypothetical protein